MKKRILIICGRAGHGKDTAAGEIIQHSRTMGGNPYQLHHPVDFLRGEFAAKVQLSGYNTEEIHEMMHGSRKDESLACLQGESYRDWMGRRIRNYPPVAFTRMEIRLLAKMGPNVVITGGRWRTNLNHWRALHKITGWEVVFVWVHRPNMPLVSEEVKHPRMHHPRGWYEIAITNRSTPKAMMNQLQAIAPHLFRV